MLDFSTDPFTQVHRRLWALLEADGGFAALVRRGNRVNTLAPAAPLGGERRDNPQDADLPEVSIEPAGGPVELFAASGSATLVEHFDIRLVTGDPRPHKALHPLKWRVLKALSRTSDDLGLGFVRHVRITSTADRPTDKRLDRGAAGWSAVITVRVEMCIPRSEMEA